MKDLLISLVPIDLSRDGSYADIGEYVGGVYGTLLSLAALIVSTISLFIVFCSWKNSKNEYKFNKVVSVVEKMAQTHDSIVVRYPEMARLFLREFSEIYKRVRVVSDQNATEWTVKDRISIAYKLAFFGMNKQSVDECGEYGRDNILGVTNYIKTLRAKRVRFNNLFKGHQEGVSQFMRNAFSAYTYIEKSDLPFEEKKFISKIIKSKMSNYDQALLAVNCCSMLGREWVRTGILNKYKVISNVPRNFFGVDEAIELDVLFPDMEFEWQRQGPEK